MQTVWNEYMLGYYWPLFLTKKVKIITIPTYLISNCPDKLAQLIQKGIIIFAFTSNDKEFIKRHSGKTVTEFYTDSITYNNLNR